MSISSGFINTLRAFKRASADFSKGYQLRIRQSYGPEESRRYIGNVFSQAKQSVLISAHNLQVTSEIGNNDSPLEVYGWSPLIGAAQTFLEGSHSQLVILLETEPDMGRENPFLKGVIEYGKRKGVVQVMVAKPDSFLSQEEHFIVADLSAVCFESDHGLHNTKVIFGDKAEALRARGKFCGYVKALRTDGNLREDASYRPRGFRPADALHTFE